MQPSDFTEKKSGRLIKHLRGYWAFVPNPLPPVIELTWDLVREISAADRGVSELAGIARTLPNPHLFIRSFIGREAVSSSRIEGTNASLSDLFYFEAANKLPTQNSDVREVHNYVLALEHGLKRLERLPISMRLLREMHAELMRGVRGEYLTPGEVRRSQNWIGAPNCTLNDAKFVPPPPEEMPEALSALEKFIHAPTALPLALRLALIHYQFEAIHPFLDGNGRIGRLLITLMLCAERALPLPLLYLSDYFERNRQDYYGHLLQVSRAGMWREWISFFLRGIEEQSRDSIVRSDKLLTLWKMYRESVQTARSSSLLLALIDELFNRPYITFSQARRVLNVTFRTAQLNINKLVRANILHELPGKKYGRVFVAQQIVEILQ